RGRIGDDGSGTEEPTGCVRTRGLADVRTVHRVSRPALRSCDVPILAGRPPVVRVAVTVTAGPPGTAPTEGGAAQVSAPRRVLDIQATREVSPSPARRLAEYTRLIYLDGGATSERPRQVIEAEVAYVEHDHAAVKRGAHRMAEAATDAYEGARDRV